MSAFSTPWGVVDGFAQLRHIARLALPTAFHLRLYPGTGPNGARALRGGLVVAFAPKARLVAAQHLLSAICRPAAQPVRCHFDVQQRPDGPIVRVALGLSLAELFPAGAPRQPTPVGLTLSLPQSGAHDLVAYPSLRASTLPLRMLGIASVALVPTRDHLEIDFASRAGARAPAISGAQRAGHSVAAVAPGKAVGVAAAGCAYAVQSAAADVLTAVADTAAKSLVATTQHAVAVLHGRRACLERSAWTGVLKARQQQAQQAAIDFARTTVPAQVVLPSSTASRRFGHGVLGRPRPFLVVQPDGVRIGGQAVPTGSLRSRTRAVFGPGGGASQPVDIVADAHLSAGRVEQVGAALNRAGLPRFELIVRPAHSPGLKGGTAVVGTAVRGHGSTVVALPSGRVDEVALGQVMQALEKGSSQPLRVQISTSAKTTVQDVVDAIDAVRGSGGPRPDVGFAAPCSASIQP